MRRNRFAVLLLLLGLAAGGCEVPDGGGDGGARPPDAPAGSDFALLAWNDLGMHCIDGKDYSIFSILPPYNNLQAELVDTRNNARVEPAGGVTLSYQAIADTRGSINTTSADKTNFWRYAGALFGVTPPDDVGLTGNPTPSGTPAPLTWSAERGLWEATGIPITPRDDAGATNYYPMVRVVARDAAGTVLATADAVLPVSDEMTCSACHRSTVQGNEAQTAARPAAGWVFDGDPEKDWKRNILRLHDERQLGVAAFDQALVDLGYDGAGLSATAEGGTPVLCAACHGSNALPGTGMAGIEPLTQALHALHGSVLDPATLAELDAVDNRSSCYLCHPGSQTECLRGAMGAAQDATGALSMACQSCHGTLSDVGTAGRAGWLDEPTCQSCHHDGVRELTALTSDHLLRSVLDRRFATTPNTPAAGFSLYRLSSGHGGLQCEACHGATHAVYPSVEPNDNVLASSLQGHVGTVAECSVCHATVPDTVDGGPHGLHTVGASWVSAHGDAAERGAQGCAACHGADYRGSPLSRAWTDRSFQYEGRTVAFTAGEAVTCYSCHDGPGGD